VSSPFGETTGAQPPRILKTAVEVSANLRQLQQSHDSLFITFGQRNQSFQSFLVDIDFDQKRLALDELVPNEGERFLKAGEPFKIEGYHDGVRIAWECATPVSFDELQDGPCYWAPLPEEIVYHQRRNAFRVSLNTIAIIDIKLIDPAWKQPIFGEVLDMSATGCKLRFKGNQGSRLQPGQRVEQIEIKLNNEVISSSLEIRHLQYDEKLDVSFVGVRFHRPSGQEQRKIERFVYQLQREARRLEE
jgi:c-di-GMP-binding flagellar brake protein YcgR